MDKKTAWENFKNTGNINMYLEMKALEKQENIYNNLSNIEDENMGDTWHIQK